MNGDRRTETKDRLSGRIDAALRAVGTAAPAPGLEGRILTRLAAARMQVGAEPAGLFRRLPRPVVPLLGFACASVMCAVIVVGSVNHSRRHHPSLVPPPPVLAVPGTGVGAASAMHPAAPATARVPAGPVSRGRSTHRTAPGRARIAPHARKAPGVAVPAPSGSSEN